MTKFVLFLGLGLQAAVGLAAELPGKQWERHFGDDKVDHYATALGASREGESVWVGGSTRESKSLAKGIALWIWRVGQNGEIAEKRSLGAVAQSLGDSFPYVRSVLEASDRRVYVVVELEEGQPSLVAVAGQEVSVHKISFAAQPKQLTIQKIVETPGGDFFAIGETDTAGLLVRLDRKGRVLWQRAFQKDGRVLAMDVLSLPEGGGLALWNSGRTEGFGLGASTVWVSRFGDRGELGKEISFPGRWGSVALRQDGSVLAYDAGTGAAQEVRFLRLDKDLSRVAESTVGKGSFGLTGFKLVSLPKGDSIVAGSLNGTLWISRVDTPGNARWSYLGLEDRLWRADGLVSSGDSVYLLSPVMDLNREEQLSRDVGLLRLTF